MTCRSCDYPLVPSNCSPAPEGFKLHRGRGLCGTCSDRERKAGRLDEWPPLRPGVHCKDGDCSICEDVQWMAETGAPVWEWSKRVSTTPRALARLLRRHGHPELASAVERVEKAVRAA